MILKKLTKSINFSNKFLHIFYKRSTWTLTKGGKYFLTRNNSTLIAFNLGKKLNRSSTCFKIIGAHSDSPNLRLAPNSFHEANSFERVITSNNHFYLVSFTNLWRWLMANLV